MPVTRVVGVDAASKHGWAAVLIDHAGYVDARAGALAEVIAWAEPVDVVGVDIPIGHATVGAARRLADQHARRFLGRRASTVFATPPAEVLEAAGYAEANETLAALGLPKLSRQAWGLVPRIVEAAAVAAADPRLVEVHPEVSFQAMAGKPLAWSKKSWNGLMLRRALLASEGIELPDTVDALGGVAADDVVDAAAVAWTARRVVARTAKSLPEEPEQVDGRAIAIWY